ncbi:MAG: hypothetical protein M0029_03220 [Actinomycetota bacterium]|jgi:hypothetical protein|nr:hypothetical protein [Actinomycetota bacterium]
MPAETHQQGRTADAETISVLLGALLSDDDVADDTVLSDLGIGADDVGDLWDAVREELAERTVGPELDPSDLDPQMTVAAAALAMASLLAGVGDRDRDRDRDRHDDA